MNKESPTGDSVGIFELRIVRMCQRYKKLPSEILNEDWEWIETIDLVDTLDREKENKTNMTQKISQRLKKP